MSLAAVYLITQVNSNGRRSYWAASNLLQIFKIPCFVLLWFYNSKKGTFRPIMSLLLHLQLFLALFGSSQLQFVASHEESGDWHCEPDEKARLVAEFKPGFVTVDGNSDDWIDVDGYDFPLRPALDPDEDMEYKAGKMAVKVQMDLKIIYLIDFSKIKWFTWYQRKKKTQVSICLFTKNSSQKEFTLVFSLMYDRFPRLY